MQTAAANAAAHLVTRLLDSSPRRMHMIIVPQVQCV